MLAFLDTEFTDLVIQPRLLSAGIVTSGNGPEFYAEVTDSDRIHATGWFGLGAVLPNFGKVANAPCTYAELGTRLAAYMSELDAGMPEGDILDLAFGYHLDWELVDLAIRDSGSASWALTKIRVRPINVYQLTGFGAGQIAADAYFKAQNGKKLSRHHALCDARALRVAYEAATRVPVSEPIQRGHPFPGGSSAFALARH